jgi:hypothetical protein
MELDAPPTANADGVFDGIAAVGPAVAVGGTATSRPQLELGNPKALP